MLELLAELRRELELRMLFITHNLGVVAAIADAVLVLNQGELCEAGPIERVFADPQSPRAVELLKAAPTLQFAA